MSMCFLTGSPDKAIKVYHVIEYIRVKPNGEVEIVADFLVENMTEKAEPLHIVHPGLFRPLNSDRNRIGESAGALTLEDATADWIRPSSDNESCVVSMRILKDFHGKVDLSPCKDGQALVLRPTASDQRKMAFLIPHADSDQHPSIRPCAEEGYKNIKLSSWETTEIPAEKKQLIRVRGLLRLDELDPLFRPTLQRIRIYGQAHLAQVVESKIREMQDDEPELATLLHLFTSFTEKRSVPAESYHFAVDCGDPDAPIDVNAVTSDLSLGFRNEHIGDKFITWYWSANIESWAVKNEAAMLRTLPALV